MIRFKGLNGAVPVALALMAPVLLAFNAPPSPTVLNQALALCLWGTALTTLASQRATHGGGSNRAGAMRMPILAMLAIVGPFGAAVLQGLPSSIALCVAATLGAAIVVAWAGSVSASSSGSHDALHGLLWGLTAAGLISAAIACVQVFAPAWPDGDWIARSALPGRAVGNLRQPNHLSSLLLWSMIATTALRSLRCLSRAGWLALQLLLCFAVVLTGSRTGALGILILAGWGLADRRLSRESRAALAALPVAFAAMWLGVSAWSHTTGHDIGGEGRLSFGHGDISSARFAIWSNTLTMIAREPMTGVGLGEFNLAWTLTALADRPIAFFDHTHNLPLQLWVELGVPLGTLLLVVLLVAFVQAWRRAWACDGDEGVAKRAAFMLVLMIGLHSLLEYPLWYAYFLLPTAFAWGFALARPSGKSVASDASAPPAGTAGAPATHRTLALAGIAMTLGAAVAVLDYWRVVVIYDPPEGAASLEERIERGQRSPLFGHHADYAAATAFGEPKVPLSSSQQLAFRRAPHQLLDVRLMIAWSQALAALGETDKARWLAARVREFRNPGADEFFAPCQRPEQAAQAFQCLPPPRVVHWREFIDPR